MRSMSSKFADDLAPEIYVDINPNHRTIQYLRHVEQWVQQLQM